MEGDLQVIPQDLKIKGLHLKTPVGTITLCIEKWKEIGAPNSILRGIQEGFPIKLIGPVIQRNLYYPRFTEKQENWITEKIEDYLKRGNLIRTREKVRLISNFFLVPKPGIKLWRLVVDLRPLNFITRMIKKIKLETLEMFLPYIKKGDFLFTLDLKDFYLHFPIKVEDRDLVSIIWKGEVYIFTTLTFGWKESPYLASKAMRCVITHLRKIGYVISNYLDDFIGIVGNEIEENALMNANKKISNLVLILKDLGFEIQDSKSQLKPLQTIVYLGLIIDTRQLKVLVPNYKLKDLYSKMAIVLKEEKLNRRFLAKIAGKLNAITLGFIPAKWCARPFHECVGRKLKKEDMDYFFWKEEVIISQEVKEVAKFFMENAKFWNGKTFMTDETFTIIETDSSQDRYGGVLNSEIIIQDVWKKEFMEKHINWKELMVVLIVIMEWQEILKNQKIVIKIDNQVAYYYLKKAGGKIKELNLLTRKIHWICFQNNIQIQKIIWVPSEENYFPDLLSRGIEVLEWELDQKIFNLIERKLGKMDIDRFAADWNHKLPRFNALNRLKGKKAEAIDCFTQNWKGVMNFVNAPFNLIPRVLRLIKQQKANTIMIIPNWNSQLWFKMAMELKKEMIELELSPQNCFSMKKGTVPEPLKNPKWKFLAIKIIF